MNFNLQKIGLKTVTLISRFSRYISLVLIIIVLLIGFFSFIQPKWNEVSETGVFDYNSEKRKLEENKRYLERLKVSMSQFDKIKDEEIQKLSKILPTQKGIPDLFIILEDLAIKSGFEAKSIDIATGASLLETRIKESTKTSESEVQAQERVSTLPSQGINTLEISYSVSGVPGYGQFKKFLENIEKELRIMDIISFSYSPRLQLQLEGEQEYMVNLRTYYFSLE